MSIKHQTVTVTADRARELLAANTRNRKISQTNYAKVKAAMVRGEWRLNGEAIKIAKDGTILDGQHRLHACADTGISFQTIVVTGLEADTQVTMDSGKARTLSDALTMLGYKSSSALAATAVGIIRAEMYSLRASVMVGGTYPVTFQQALDRIEAEPAIEEVAYYGKRFSRVGLAGKTASVLYYEFSKINPDDAQHFFDRLFDGDRLEKGSPIYALRNQLIDAKDNVKGTRSQTYLAAIVIKAWNKYRDGDSAQVIRFVPGGATPEKFPEPR